jgi:S1-C subfamily serine protease|tara:strand:+ start:1581 stop:2363 length:783 start_codon:yes stop_codon:yes gene_type:complete
MLFVSQNLNYNELSTDIAETQSNINTLTETLVETKDALEETIETLNIKIDSEITSIDKEVNLLKASAGEDFSGIVEDSISSVVTIRTDVGQGTGFIIVDNGYIVTNAHVLAGGSEIQVLTYEQDVINANFIGYNSELDIALIKIPGDYNELILGDSDDLQIGEKVIAIGNPLGLQFSVSQGIISAIHREGINKIDAYIQTDAALNPGNSGGPLINEEGKVIGINNFKIGSSESLGFALESNYIKTTVNRISTEVLNQSLL